MVLSTCMGMRHAAVEADRTDGESVTSAVLEFSRKRRVLEWLVKAEKILGTFAATENGSLNVAAQQLGGLSNSWQFRLDAEWLIGTNSGEGGLRAMLRLQQEPAPFIYDGIQAAMTVATAVAIHHLIDFGVLFLRQSFLACCSAWFTTLPIAVLAAPIIRRFVSALSAPGASSH